MLTGDLANSPLASTDHTPADEADSLEDLLAEPLHLARLASIRIADPPSPGKQVAEYVPLDAKAIRSLIAQQIKSAGLDPQDGSRENVRASRRLTDEEIVEIMTMLSCDTNHTLAIHALCWLRYMGKEGRSFDKIGEEFGVVRATVQAIDKTVKERYAQRGIILTSRADKSPSSREACRKRRVGQRKNRNAWKGTKIWQTPSQNSAR